MDLNDTIAAIATPFGSAALALIRVSGDDAIKLCATIFKGKDLNKAKPNTVHYGHILSADNQIIDEVMVSVFLAPKSFTGENSVEITTHGGILVSQKVLERLLETKIRLAEPGEFSKRAYLNKRIDLVQAEAIMDIIGAQNENALKLAHKALGKQISNLIANLNSQVLNLIAAIEVNIDYPEYDDAPVINNEIILPQTLALIEQIDHILINSKKTQYIKEGIKTVIIGKPNVGKSSLLNALLDEDRAIVSDIPGTTRDTIDAHINLKGVSLHLIDTAGIRETTEAIEAIGVSRTRKAISEAQLVLLVVDQSKPLDDEDLKLIESTNNMPRIIIANKKDLASKLTINHEVISLSSLKKEGFDELENAILTKMELDNLNDGDFNYLSNVRHIQKLKDAKAALLDVVAAVKLGLPADIYVIDLTRAWNCLGDILGNHAYGNLLDELFSKFCLGK